MLSTVLLATPKLLFRRQHGSDVSYILSAILQLEANDATRSLLAAKRPRVQSTTMNHAAVWPALRCSIHLFCTSAAPEGFARIDIERLNDLPEIRDSASHGDAWYIGKRVARVRRTLHEREIDAEPQLLPDAIRPPAPIDVFWGPGPITKGKVAATLEINAHKANDY